VPLLAGCIAVFFVKTPRLAQFVPSSYKVGTGYWALVPRIRIHGVLPPLTIFLHGVVL